MTHLTDRWVVPWLAILADWSIRWGIVLAPLAVWFALRPPRRTAIRSLLCLSALAAGVLLPVAPRWGDAVVPWPSRSVGVAGGSPTSMPPPAGPEAPGARPALSRAATGPGPQHRSREVVLRKGPARARLPLPLGRRPPPWARGGSRPW
jgi:hypothetical protein